MKNRSTLCGYAVLFSAVLAYYEILFRLFTTGTIIKLATVFMLLFCIAYGCAGSFLVCILPGEKGKKIGSGILIFLTAIVFLVESLIYQQFKLFYDLNTVFAGAADVAGSYSRETFMTVFSASGILKVVLFFLPAVAFIIFRKKLRFEKSVRWYQYAAVLCASVLIFGGSILGIKTNTALNPVWKTQYSFQTATGNFGLLTGIGLDLREIVLGSSAELNTDVSMPEVEESTEPAAEETEPPIEYGLNQLDIDFSSLEAEGPFAQLNAYVASREASSKNAYTGLFEGKNLIFITAEAFALEVIDPDLTPTLYRLANNGIQFTDYYQMSGSGTTGGEYQNLFGLVPTSGGYSFKATAKNLNYYTIGSMLDRLGYYGQAFHNNSYTYYSRHLTHENIGYSAGFMGYGNGIEKYVSHQWPQSDLEMFAGTIDLYIENQPFNIYYMTVSGHSFYSTSSNDMTRKNWDRVSHLECSNVLKGYFAAQLELEDSLTYLVKKLEEYGIADDTVICLTADHFPYGLDNNAGLGYLQYLSELYGYTVDDVWERDHNSWILWCGSLEAEEPIVVDSPTCSLDILPTLANLFGVEFDSRLLIGRDVFADTDALVINTDYDWKTEYGVYNAYTGVFTQTKPDVILPDDYVASIGAIVQNKLYYCRAVLKYDYFRYLFGDS